MNKHNKVFKIWPHIILIAIFVKMQMLINTFFLNQFSKLGFFFDYDPSIRFDQIWSSWNVLFLVKLVKINFIHQSISSEWFWLKLQKLKK